MQWQDLHTQLGETEWANFEQEWPAVIMLSSDSDY